MPLRAAIPYGRSVGKARRFGRGPRPPHRRARAARIAIPHRRSANSHHCLGRTPRPSMWARSVRDCRPP